MAARGRFVLAVSGGQHAVADAARAGGLDVPWTGSARRPGRRACRAGRRSRPQPHALAREPARARAAAARNRCTRCRWKRRTSHGGRGALCGGARSGSPARRRCSTSSHLGLGPDGHTASLVPGDPVLDVDDADVALAGPYQGRRRMTLTYPALDRARRILWVVTGAEKARDAAAPLLAATVDSGRARAAGARVRARRSRGGGRPGIAWRMTGAAPNRRASGAVVARC